MDYELNSITSSLKGLKSSLTALENVCTSDVLDSDMQKWSTVKKFIDDLVIDIEDVISTWPEDYGKSMKNIDEDCPKG